VEDYRRSIYGDLRVSTFVKLASARMVCFCDASITSHGIYHMNHGDFDSARGLSVVNFLLPRTWVVYMRNTPRSHDLYITYTHAGYTCILIRTL